MRLLGRVGFYVVWPALVVYLWRSQRSRVLVQHEGQVLLVKNWLGDGKWSLPGGGMHAGEPIHTGAARELHEETGIVATDDQLELLRSEPYAFGPIHFNAHYFRLTMSERPSIRPQRFEIAEVCWMDAAAIEPEQVNDDVRRALDLVQ
ncbi:MAG: rppH 2 [Candidatus Saccharibacteria bacterium]|nr:rppH 2 [Candidatus Saccharibacteria bacterium]